MSFLGFDSIKIKDIKDTYNKDLVSLRKQLDNTVYNVTLAQVQAARAEYDKSSFEHQINFTNTLIILNQNLPSFCKQELERSKAELDALGIQVNNKKQEIEERKNEMKQQLDHVQALNKKLDNELVARIAGEIELETCREELLFMKAVYQEEHNEFMTFGTFQFDVDQFYRTEITRAIANIRNDYELLARAQYHEWEGKKLEFEHLMLHL
jgi:chromosome segregation ATPase